MFSRSLALVLCTALLILPYALAQSLRTENVVVAAGVPLRIALDRKIPLKRAGQSIAVQGKLALPVYVGDELVLPQGAEVLGNIVALDNASKRERLNARMSGDFSPLHVAHMRFNQITLAGGQTLRIQTDEAQRSGQLVRFQSGGLRKPSLFGRVKQLARERKDEAVQTVAAPGKMERLKQRLISSLPYHSQWIPAGTQYDAELAAPLKVSLPAHRPDLEQLGSHPPANTAVKARLLSTISSSVDSRGSQVEAQITEPVFNARHKLLLPQGTILNGSVVQSKRAKWFGRNGQLRFTFTSIQLPGNMEQTLHGQVAAAEADPQAHLKVDAEGGTEAQPAKGRYLAPLTLGLLAASAQTDDEGGGPQGAVAGGFGLLGRVIALAARSTPVSAGFSYYALSRSLYSRWIAKGHDVTFPTDTRLEIQFGAR